MTPCVVAYIIATAWFISLLLSIRWLLNGYDNLCKMGIAYL